MFSSNWLAMRRSVRLALASTLVVGWVGVGSYAVLLSGQPAFLFDPSLRVLCKLQRPFTGLSLQWGKAEGALRTGELRVTDLRARWKSSGMLGSARPVECDVTVDELNLRLGVDTARMVLRDGTRLKKRLTSSDQADEVKVEMLHASGVRGTWAMLRRTPGTPPPNLVIEDLYCVNVKDFAVADCWMRQKPLVFPVVSVTELRMTPYR